MQEHIANSEHFMAMDRFVMDANTIFGNAEIREIIRDKYGKNFLAILDKHLKDIVNDGVQSTHPEMGMIAKFRKHVYRSFIRPCKNFIYATYGYRGVF
ncbi:MAG: hypothetical protein L6V95_09795 [Candidatus Melainabacteria bacterium]|nr:MAG: hypothetical protein L6V95_09795 [Candidatus Melainabacteria bacterium]